MDSTLTERQRKIILGKIEQIGNCTGEGMNSEKEDLKKAIFGLFYCSLITSKELDEFSGLVDSAKRRVEVSQQIAFYRKYQAKGKEREFYRSTITDDEIRSLLSRAVGEENRKSAGQLAIAAGISANRASAIIKAAKNRGFPVMSSNRGYWLEEKENRPDERGTVYGERMEV